MFKQEQSERSEGRSELPIERGFPIERVNEIAEKESRAKQYYRPIYTMHKWWARRPGSLFRAITLYSLFDEETTTDSVEVHEPGKNQTLGDNGSSTEELVDAISEVSMENPEPLWNFYSKDVRIEGKKILDPFMGGGTSLVEGSRFGVDSVGVDLNPVAWFITKKELEAGQTTAEELEEAFQQVEEDVADEILQYYKTPCPNGDHDADVMYNFWIKELDCISCGETIPLFNDYRVAAGRYENDDKYNVYCPECDSVTLVDGWQSESRCKECNHEWVPKNGNVTRGGDCACSNCGQKFSMVDAVEEQNGYDLRLYAVEYYCAHCDDQEHAKSAVKGYKDAAEADRQLYDTAVAAWESNESLHEYVPDERIPRGAITAASSVSGNDVFQHGYETWTDMFNERQLLCLSTLLRSIDHVENASAREFLLLAFTESLNFNTMMVPYQAARNHTNHVFKSNSFAPPRKSSEGNVWGTEYGIGRFRSTFGMILNAVAYANAPTDRYIKDGETTETAGFAQPIGENTEICHDDMRNITAKDEYDAVITDPPYYDNIIYSEVADYYYVWQKILIEGEYPGFDQEKTPRTESIVTNPYLDKTAEDFEHEMGQALTVIKRALKSDGTLAFTYHHSDSESWGELLESLCETGFEITATYPINSDMQKFIGGESVSFDIVIVARPTDELTPISWNQLRRRIVRTAAKTREILEETRELTSGDIGVIEMGKCFQEYSHHHGAVRRAGNTMSAKDVVNEIYGIIQEGERGEQDVYLDILEERNPSYSDLNKHIKRSDASEETMKEMKLFRMDGGDFFLCDWNDEKRQAYVQSKVEGDNGDLTPLDKAHFLRYRYEHDRSRDEFLSRWDVDELQECCEDLAAVTGDETHLKMLGVDTTLAKISDE